MSKWGDFYKQLKAVVNWKIVAEEILGLELIGEPNDKGWVKCRSVDGDDENPSAGFNILTGYYKDWRDGQKACSSFDLMVQIEKAETFMQAKKILGDKFGVLFPSIELGDPLHGVKWQNWNDNLAKPFCIAKPPITVDGLKRAGARMCMRYGEACFAFPIWGWEAGEVSEEGSNLSPEPVGWMFIPRSGLAFSHESAKGAKSIAKVNEGAKVLFITSREILEEINQGKRAGWDTEARCTRVYWTEGAPDMLAALSVYPNLLVVTNPHGCAERASTNCAAWLAGRTVVTVIGDADVPGCRGAVTKMASLEYNSATRGESCALARRPKHYEIDEKHGKDLRDSLREYKYAAIDEHLTEVSIDDYQVLPPPEWDAERQESKKKKREERLKDMNHEISEAESMLEDVQMTITSVNPDGRVSLHSMYTKQTRIIVDIAQSKYPFWVQFLGAPFAGYVVESNADKEVKQAAGIYVISFRDFLRQLGLLCSSRVGEAATECGAGIWPIKTIEGVATGEVLLVQTRKCHLITPDGQVNELLVPVHGTYSGDLSTRVKWYKPEEFNKYMKEAHDVAWRTQVYSELFGLFENWNWENDSMSQLVIGLTMATSIQSALQWRPLVCVTGESNSGKTFLFQAMNNLFGGLAQFTGRSTAAGIMQSIENDSRPLLIDELDSSKDPQKLFQLFRTSSRGQETVMGTSRQTHKQYKSCHIPWLSGIFASTKDQADKNRMIALRLLKKPAGKKVMQLPNPEQLRDLGVRMMCGVIATVKPAIEAITYLTQHGESELQSRYRESFAVPFGCLGAFLGMNVDGCAAVMDEYLTSKVAPEIEEDGESTDQETLLMEILQTEVRLGAMAPMESATVAEILFDSRLIANRDACRTKGVAYVVSKKTGAAKVCFSPNHLVRRRTGVLGDTKWADQPGIVQVIRRLPESLGVVPRDIQAIAGTSTACVSVNYDKLRKWAEARKTRQEAV